MTVIAIPKALRERLGEEGSQGLVDIISAIDERAREDSLRLLSERFERRLSEEIGKVNERITGLDEKITSLEERFERRLSEEIGKVNERITLEIGKINERITAEIGGLRQDMERFRSELIKWMFIFWVGQIAVLGGLIVGIFNLAR